MTTTRKTSLDEIDRLINEADGFGQITDAEARTDHHALAAIRAARVARELLDRFPVVEFTVECPRCGSPASAGKTVYVNDSFDGVLVLDLGMDASQMTFSCTNVSCPVVLYSGDYEDLLVVEESGKTDD